MRFDKYKITPYTLWNIFWKSSKQNVSRFQKERF